MLIDSPIISRGSGSLAGLTMSRNRGGQYFRARAMPTNPNTPDQQRVRSFMSDLSSRWSSTLTKEQRDSWDSYAANVLLPGPLGDLRNVGGIGMYQRCNIARLNGEDATLTRLDSAPTIFNLGDYTAPVMVSATSAIDGVSFSFEATDEWANEDGAAMIICLSRPKNASINYFKGPYRLAAVVLGDSATPPTSPVLATNPFTFESGHKIFGFARVTRVDGRLSSSWRGNVVAT